MPNENKKLSAEEKCQPGYQIFTGGEIKHDKNCVFYPESLTKIHDDLVMQCAEWQPLLKIAPPEKWLEMFRNYQDALLKEDVDAKEAEIERLNEVLQIIQQESSGHLKDYIALKQKADELYQACLEYQQTGDILGGNIKFQEAITNYEKQE